MTTSSQSNESGLSRRRSPLSELDPFRELLDRPFGFSRLLEGPLGARPQQFDWAPAMDVHESSDAYVVTVELPGTKKDDISIEAHDNVLTIKGEKKSEREESNEHRHYRERSYGSFSRSLRLPADATDDVKASFRDGVLTVSIPKAAERKPRVVSIDP